MKCEFTFMPTCNLMTFRGFQIDAGYVFELPQEIIKAIFIIKKSKLKRERKAFLIRRLIGNRLDFLKEIRSINK